MPGRGNRPATCRPNKIVELLFSASRNGPKPESLLTVKIVLARDGSYGGGHGVARLGTDWRLSACIGGQSEFAPRTLSKPAFHVPPMNREWPPVGRPTRDGEKKHGS